MKKLRKLFTSIMPPQKWHVCWVAQIPGREITYGDGVFTFSVGLDVGQLRVILASDTSEAAGCEVEPKQINITGLCRIR